MPSDSSSPAPAIPSPPPSPSAGDEHATCSKKIWQIALGALAAVIVALYLVQPYQHWEFGFRMSVLRGWLAWITKYSDWQFCLVVPVITGWLVWLRRAELRRLPWRGNWLGILPLLAGLFVYWVGFKADTGYPGFLSIQLVLAGMILTVMGLEWMRKLFFAWLFLFFAWPMQPLEDSLASPLRYQTATITGRLLSMMGMPSVSEGSALQSAPDKAAGLELGDRFSLDIDEACSGINSLFALMMIAALLGYLALKSPRSRLILFVCAVPLAVLGNIARLVMLAFGSVWLGSDVAVGKRIGEHQEMSFFHTCAGFAVFGVALVGMFTLCWLLEGREMKANLKRLQKTAAAPILGHVGAFGARRQIWLHTGVVVAFALLTLGVCQMTDTRYLVANAGVRVELPLEIGTYQGRELEVMALEKKLLDEGVKLARTAYMNVQGRQIIASVILSGMIKRSLHRPEVCLPGQGWTIAESRPTQVSLKDGASFDATMLRIFVDKMGEDGRRKRMRGVNIYWYVGSDDTTCASHYEHVFVTYRDAIFRNVNHRWAMVSIFIPIPEESGDEFVHPESMFAEFNAIEDAREFAGQFLPAIREPQH